MPPDNALFSYKSQHRRWYSLSAVFFQHLLEKKSVVFRGICFSSFVGKRQDNIEIPRYGENCNFKMSHFRAFLDLFLYANASD